MAKVKAPAASCCRHCGKVISHTLVDLGMSPLCESFLTEAQLEAMEAFFPLHVRVCDSCFLVQLPQFVSPEHIFTEYAYFSSYSTSWVAHAKRHCETMTARLGLGPKSFVVELASNDGYLLQHFLPLGVPVLGVEPAANVAHVAREAGVPTLVSFFNSQLAEQIAADKGHADLIISNNVLAQVPDLNDFVDGMRTLLAPEGVITLEVPHLARLIAERQFDTIYHEHFSYFSLYTLTRIAGAHGLKVFDVEKLPTHGGSLRVFMAHATAERPETAAAVREVLDEEHQAGLLDVSGYLGFSAEVQRIKHDLLSFLIEAKRQGKRTCGYGAPGKGNTLLNYCGIGTDLLEFTVDRNPYKHGRFTPGMHIPIYPVEALERAKPDYILILPWNLKTEIIQQLKHASEWGAKFVIPIPETTIIDPLDLSQ